MTTTELPQVWAPSSPPKAAVVYRATDSFAWAEQAQAMPPGDGSSGEQLFGYVDDRFRFDESAAPQFRATDPFAFSPDLARPSGRAFDLFAFTETAVYDTSPPTNVYGNGYATRVRVVLPRPAAATTLVNAVVRLDVTRNRLRSTANGGEVRSEGRDVRVEDAGSGTVHPSRLVYHDPATGRLIVDVHLGASLTLSTTAYKQLYIYAGKAGVPALANAATDVFGSYAFALEPATGYDLTGRGRHLSWVGTPSFPLAPEGPAVAFDGSGACGRSAENVTGFHGLAALSVVARVQSALTAVPANGVHGICCVGPTLGEGWSRHVFTIHCAAAGILGGAANTLVVGVTVRKTDNTLETARWEGPAGSGLFTTPTQLAIVWSTGQAIKVYKGGTLLVPTWAGAQVHATGQTVAGATVVGTTGSDTSTAVKYLYVGRGAFSTGTAGFNGRIEQLHILGRAMT